MVWEKLPVENILRATVIGLLILALMLQVDPAFAENNPSNISQKSLEMQIREGGGDPSLPDWEAPLNPDFSDNEPLVYKDGVEDRQGIIDKCKSCTSDSANAYSPTIEPFAPTVKVIATWPSGTSSECSGVLVQARFILTTGHCVYTHNPDRCIGTDSCWVDNLQVFSKYDLGEGYYQETTSTQILTWTAWTENKDFNYDLAAVELADPLGMEVGWLGYGYNNDDTFFTGTFENFSYPTEDPFDGKTMHPWEGNFEVIEDHRLISPGTSLDGQSGAASRSTEDLDSVYSVLSHNLDVEGENITGHTRITDDKFFTIRDWIRANTQLDFHCYLPALFQ